jgi:hypothetical protein
VKPSADDLTQTLVYGFMMGDVSLDADQQKELLRICRDAKRNLKPFLET